MSKIEVSGREPVLKAIAEYDSLGKDLFLSKYGFNAARTYYVFHDGKYYDSKAILGVSHQYDDLGRALRPDEFSGGEATVVPVLQRHNFVVKLLGAEKLPQDAAIRSPLILVSSDRTAGGKYDFWEDTTGVQYHFPNGYKNKIVTGRRFIYYRGIRTRTGRRSQPEYYGAGVIGDVWLDPNTDMGSPKRNWKWYCGIDDYIPFRAPVEWKRPDGTYFEDIPQAMRQVAVREIPWTVYYEIEEYGGITSSPVSTREMASSQLPDLTGVRPHAARVLDPPRSGSNQSNVDSTESTAGDASRRYRRQSMQSKIVGDRAEAIVYKYLSDNATAIGVSNIRWVAREGLKPGWDIEYEDRNRTLICVEVKGSVQETIQNFQLTANEWKKAEQFGGNYCIFLVGNCLTEAPSIEILKDPCSLVRSGLMAAQPDSWILFRC